MPGNVRRKSSSVGKVHWREIRCGRCGHLLQKVEENALRPGKRLEIKCGRCKSINSFVGGEPDARTDN